MGEVRPLPSPGDVFTDARGEARTMRVSYHAEPEVLVVSFWVGGLCRGTFRMAPGDIDRLVTLLESVRTGPVELTVPPGQTPLAGQAQTTPPVAAQPADDPVDATGEVLRSVAGPGLGLAGTGAVPSAA